MDESLRRDDYEAERINILADPNHFWNYRMHITLEDLIREKHFNSTLRADLEASGRV